MQLKIKGTSVKILFIVLLTSMVSACAVFSTIPSKNQNLQHLLNSSEMISTIFKHRIALFTSSKKETTLKVFIEGDGRPWLDGKHIRKDPSPKTLMVFDLLKQTTGDRLYLGRPCYFQTEDERCHYSDWTSHRYSQKVIKSMALAITQIKEAGEYTQTVIIGHSGGGVIATLLACELNTQTPVITLAANLDIDQWTQVHQWSPLAGSLNPSNLPVECKSANSFHFYGGKDKNVTQESAQAFFATGKANQHLIPDATHDNWPLFWEYIKDLTHPLLRN